MLNWLKKLLVRNQVNTDYVFEERTSPAGISYLFQHRARDKSAALAFSFDGGYLDEAATSPPAVLVAPQVLIKSMFSASSVVSEDTFLDNGCTVICVPKSLETQCLVAGPIAHFNDAIEAACALVDARSPIGSGVLEESVSATKEFYSQQKENIKYKAAGALIKASVTSDAQFNPQQVTDEAFDAVTQGHIKQWKSKNFCKARLLACLTGPFASSDADLIIDRLAASLPNGQPSMVQIPKLKERTAPQKIEAKMNASEAGHHRNDAHVVCWVRHGRRSNIRRKLKIGMKKLYAWR
jgi:hypothetical protein